MDLPRKYLSYSAFALWKSSKESFRKKYYLNQESFTSIETNFGKKQHAKMESNPDVKGSETKLECVIESTPLLGYVDSLDPDTLKVIDFKFSHLDKKGKEPWDNVKVRKHQQFPFYCLMVKQIHGTYNPEVELHWHETKFEFDPQNNSLDLITTGNVKVFKRTIEEYELENIKNEIIKVTGEISQDYILWKSTNNTQN